MGVGTALTVGGLTVGGLTSLVGSAKSLKASYAEAAALRVDGDYTYYDSLMEAYQVETEAAHFKEAQAMKYVMSGVSLQGTPMQVLDYTSKQAQMEIDHIKSRGERQRELSYIQAANLESGARAKMFNSIAETTVSAVSGFARAAQGGIFDQDNAADMSSLLGNGTKTTIEYNYKGNLGGLA